jgi:flagellar basal body L-ring protein FlgH
MHGDERAIPRGDVVDVVIQESRQKRGDKHKEMRLMR